MADLKKTVIITAYYLSALLLVLAGILKLANPSVGDIQQYLLDREYLSWNTVVLIERTLPWLEIALGTIALSGWRIELSAKGLAALYLFFALVILFVSEGFLTVPLDCGCFGKSEGTPVYLLLLRNLLLSLPLLFVNSSYRKFALWYLLKR